MLEVCEFIGGPLDGENHVVRPSVVCYMGEECRDMEVKRFHYHAVDRGWRWVMEFEGYMEKEV